MFPLLGILGLGAAALAKPYYDEWAEERMGRRAGEALEGLGDDPQAQQKGLLLGGLLDAETYAGFGADRQQTAMSLGPQWMNAQTARDRLNWDRQQGAQSTFGSVPPQFMVPDPEGNYVNSAFALDALSGIESGGNYRAVNETTGALGRYQIMPANVGPWTEKVLGTAMTPEAFLADDQAQDIVAQTIFGENVKRYGLADAVSIWHSGVPLQQAIAEGRHDGNMSTADYTNRVLTTYQMNEQRAAQLRDPIMQEAQVRGAPWVGMKPEERQAILTAETGIDVMATTIDYLEDTTAAGRAVDPGTKANMQTQWNLTVLPFLQSMFQAGAMQEAELALFQEFAGSGFDMNQFTGAEQSKMKGLLAQAEARLLNQKRSYGISDYSSDPFAGFEKVE
jgi:hypothetical protein